MRLPRRKFLRLVTVATATSMVSHAAWAQAYPSRYVRFIVPFPPGGSSDPVARLLANRLAEIWGQQVVIENKGGAGGNLGAQAAAQSTPDGYTLFIGTSFLATNPYLFTTAGYDPIKDFAPVTRLTTFTNVLVVPNSSPAKSVSEFLEYAKSNHGKTTFGSAGTGTIQHLTGELFKRDAGIELTHIPYRGGGPALNDLIPGRIDAMIATLPSVLPQIQSGSIRAIAVTSGTRVAFAPNIPTVAESGLPGFDVSDGHVLLMPARTPVEFISKANGDVIAALAHPAVKQRLDELTFVIATSTPAQLTAYLKSEMDKGGAVIREANIKVD
jgi:tripartite-type tricarboxylate transporter receptor subunit TctC